MAIVTNFNEQPNQVWLNNGQGVFTDSGQSLGSPGYGKDVALGDIDGDGDLDAFVTNTQKGTENQPDRIWLNNGRGYFTDSGQRLGESYSRISSRRYRRVMATWMPVSLTGIRARQSGRQPGFEAEWPTLG
jgi:hypothetical protein